jgi:hypothetical protein
MPAPFDTHARGCMRTQRDQATRVECLLRIDTNGHCPQHSRLPLTILHLVSIATCVSQSRCACIGQRPLCGQEPVCIWCTSHMCARYTPCSVCTYTVPSCTLCVVGCSLNTVIDVCTPRSSAITSSIGTAVRCDVRLVDRDYMGLTA